MNLYDTGRSEAIPPDKDIFARFIGEWQLQLTVFRISGASKHYTGKWHFTRILNGHAVQDVRMILSAGGNADGANDGYYEYGTTVKTYDRVTGKWKAIWAGPIQNQLFVFDVLNEGDKIILNEQGHVQPKMQWIFYDMGENHFQWMSRVCMPVANTWFTNYHMQVHRVLPNP